MPPATAFIRRGHIRCFPREIFTGWISGRIKRRTRIIWSCSEKTGSVRRATVIMNTRTGGCRKAGRLLLPTGKAWKNCAKTCRNIRTPSSRSLWAESRRASFRRKASPRVKKRYGRKKEKGRKGGGRNHAAGRSLRVREKNVPCRLTWSQLSVGGRSISVKMPCKLPCKPPGTLPVKMAGKVPGKPLVKMT